MVKRLTGQMENDTEDKHEYEIYTRNSTGAFDEI